MDSIELVRFLRNFRCLPVERQVAVRQLVDRLAREAHESRSHDAAALSAPSFAAVWDNDADADYDHL